MDPVNLLIVTVLVLFSGLFSGLTLGLMTLDAFELKRKMSLGDKQAAKLYPLRKHGNLLLSTLLMGNVVVNSILSVFLGSLTVGVVAVIISTGLILIIGEILPQAVISRYALSFGARTTWLVKIFIVLFFPVTKPIAILLNSMLGRELPTVYSKKELALLVGEQKGLVRSDVDQDDAQLMVRSLTFSDKTVKSVMTPWENTFAVVENQLLSRAFLNEVLKHGHSRVPVLNTSSKKVVGILYAKDLISLRSSKKTRVRDVMRKHVFVVSENDNLDDVLNLFRKEKIHLFIVQKRTITGIITLEDTLEEITGEIVDEHDRHEDMRKIGEPR